MKIPAFDHVKAAAFLLRAALSVVFLYAAISSTLAPDEWVGYLPRVLLDHFDASVLLKIFSVYELLIAAFLILGIYVRYAALVAALTLGGIIVSNFSLFAITFRDMALILAALALALLSEEKDMPPTSKK
jgi:uncharacterized membrane protein YphA (DoxX/SURF4 family)